MVQIYTDTSANLMASMYHEYDIHVISLYYYVDGEEHTCLDVESFDTDGYYKAIGGGKKVTTSQITPGQYLQAFRPHLEAGEDIVYISMAKNISGTWNSAETASQQLREEFPERRITVINTKGAGLGEGIVALVAAQCRANGGDYDAICEAAVRATRYIMQIFTVDDLNYLGRTGRVSNFTAFIGTALNIKPLLKGTDDGVIATFEKARGRKKALKSLLKYYEEDVVNASERTVFITHTNAKEDAEQFAQQIRESSQPPKEVIVLPHEPITGSHLGPGALALFFISKHNRDTGKDDGLY